MVHGCDVALRGVDGLIRMVMRITIASGAAASGGLLPGWTHLFEEQYLAEGRMGY